MTPPEQHDRPRIDAEKRAAAQAAAALVPDGARVGLGHGSTVAHLLPALAARGLTLRCVAVSPATARAASAVGLPLSSLDDVGELDIAIDGADQVAPGGWLIKGGGGAHTHEKLVASAARRFVVIASSDKVLPALRPPVPLEILRFGAAATLRAAAPATLRDAPPSPEGNLIADHHGPVDDPAGLAARLAATPGIVEHGLFPPSLVSEVLVARDGRVERVAGGR
jgi:ribose 5-phosphate isomerase A